MYLAIEYSDVKVSSYTLANSTDLRMQFSMRFNLQYKEQRYRIAFLGTLQEPLDAGGSLLQSPGPFRADNDGNVAPLVLM